MAHGSCGGGPSGPSICLTPRFRSRPRERVPASGHTEPHQLKDKWPHKHVEEPHWTTAIVVKK